jgi:hypothetical protein
LEYYKLRAPFDSRVYFVDRKVFGSDNVHIASRVRGTGALSNFQSTIRHRVIQTA